MAENNLFLPDGSRLHPEEGQPDILRCPACLAGLSEVQGGITMLQDHIKMLVKSQQEGIFVLAQAIRAVGGEIRISDEVLSHPENLELTREYDPKTSEIVFKAFVSERTKETPIEIADDTETEEQGG